MAAAAIGFMLTACACSSPETPAPQLSRVVPDEAGPDLDQPILIQGQDFLIQAIRNLENRPAFICHDDFSAQLQIRDQTPVALFSVSRVSATELSAIVPAGLPQGIYDLTVSGPFGPSEILLHAYQVKGSTCDTDADGDGHIHTSCGGDDCDDFDPAVWQLQTLWVDQDSDGWSVGGPVTFCTDGTSPSDTIESPSAQDDNCPQVHNPQQIDLDSDGVGEACDLCPALPDPTNGDLDRDGTGDVCDPCPEVAYEDPHDEDGDAIYDVCDNCPSLANPGQDDLLEIGAGNAADGVGDVCDPRPTQSGDGIEFFDGFGPDPSDWTAIIGDWSRVADMLVQHDINATNALFTVDGSTNGNVVIELVLRYTSIGFPTSNTGPALRLTVPNSGWNCALRADGPLGQLRHYQLVLGAGEPLASFDLPAAPQTGVDYRIQARGFGNQTDCDLDFGMWQTSYTSPQDLSGQYGIRVTRAAIEVDYFLVYALGGP